MFRIPPDYAIVIYAVGIQEGGEEEWEYLWTKAQKTQVASEAEIMMNALAYTQEPWLLWRFTLFIHIHSISKLSHPDGSGELPHTKIKNFPNPAEEGTQWGLHHYASPS